MKPAIPHITVCICTYQRPGLLGKLLRELTAQETRDRFTYSVVVSDNDRQESAREAVQSFQKESALEVKYCVEPEQNIALARNRALANARGEFVAFIDDDEFPVKDWLLQLLLACEEHKSAGVLGPVYPRFEREPPRWFVKGRFYFRPEYPTGRVLDWRETRTGNVLLRRQVLEGIAEPFRRQFGSGSEDTDFFRRLSAQGNVFTWCREAAVHEVVPAERCSRDYLLRRAILRGQSKRHTADFRSVAKSCLAALLYFLALPFLLVMGQHVFMRHLVSLCDHVGKLAGVLGFTPMGDTYITTSTARAGLPIPIESSKASCLPR